MWICVSVCYRNTGNTVLLSRFLIYMSIHDLSYKGQCCEDMLGPDPKRLRTRSVSFKLTHNPPIYSESQTLLCYAEVYPFCWSDDVWHLRTSWRPHAHGGRVIVVVGSSHHKYAPGKHDFEELKHAFEVTRNLHTKHSQRQMPVWLTGANCGHNGRRLLEFELHK